MASLLLSMGTSALIAYALPSQFLREEHAGALGSATSASTLTSSLASVHVCAYMVYACMCEYSDAYLCICVWYV